MNILIGVTGGIAAYKTCELVRLLVKSNHNVKVAMTKHAKEFIHPNTFAALTGHPVYDDLFNANDDIMLHITLAKWAEKIIIAPATASVISKLTTGQADDLLTTTCLASNATMYVAPAMNMVMWKKSVTQDNIVKLTQQGYKLIPPGSGEQACGDYGFGRMAEPEAIYKITTTQQVLPLSGVKVLITAGPTQEAIDPVRYISNHSSGKMGYALATTYQSQGAETTLITGPTHLDSPTGCRILKVTTTKEMYDAALTNAKAADIFISAAAVADYKPSKSATSKIKKHDPTMMLELTRNPDILQAVSKLPNKPFTVGFCAETHNLIENAKQKLTKKHLNAIIANQISSSGYPFGNDTNELFYITHDHAVAKLAHDTKKNLAVKLIAQIMQDYVISTTTKKVS